MSPFRYFHLKYLRWWWCQLKNWQNPKCDSRKMWGYCAKAFITPCMVDVLFLNLSHWHLLFYLIYSCCPWTHLENPGSPRCIWWCCGPHSPSDVHFPDFPPFSVVLSEDLFAFPQQPPSPLPPLLQFASFLENRKIYKDRGLGWGWVIFFKTLNIVSSQTKPRAGHSRAAEPRFPGFGWRKTIVYQQLS